MFCSNCGTQLPDETRFCFNCGTPTGEPPVQPEPAPQTSMQPTNPAPVAEAPVYTAPPVEAPVYTAPVAEAPAYTPIPEPAYVPPAPAYSAYTPAEAPTASDPAVPAAEDAPKKKKKKKAGPIIAIVLILVLVIGGIGAFAFIQHKNQEAYDAAVSMLEAKEYDEALAAFEALGSFSDAAEQAETLISLQEDYDHALSLLESHRYEEAMDAFRGLDDYRDSREYVDNKVHYEKACYLMDCAASGDSAGLDIAYGEENVPVSDEEGELSAILYSCAAAEFSTMPDYADSAELASECYLQQALIYLKRGDFSGALDLMEVLNEEDAAALNTAYQEACADGQFLADIPKVFDAWWDNDNAYNFYEEIDNALAILDPYYSRTFDDWVLESYMYDVGNALLTMQNATSTSGDVTDWVLYYEGMAEIFAVADLLQAEYSVFSGNSDYMDWFVGKADTYACYPDIEADLQAWWVDATAYPGDDGHYYVEYTNYSGYDYTLYCEVYFYDPYDTLLEISDILEIHVDNGETVYIPTIPVVISDDDWSSFGMNWWFSID